MSYAEAVTPPSPSQPSPLGVLLGLAQRARRAASFDELRFIIVNQTITLSPYRQAMLWSAEGGVIAVSGVSSVESNSPYILLLDRLCTRQMKVEPKPAVLMMTAVPEDERAQWAEWLPAHLLFLPLRTPGGERLGFLMIARDEMWNESELVVLNELAETYAYAWAWHRRPTLWRLWKKKWQSWQNWRRFLIALPLLALLFPVHLSVLAPGEVVARDPAILHAPLNGVVEKVLVQPNEVVVEGQPLFDLDTTVIRGDLEVAQKELATAKAEYEQNAQQAFSDIKAKAQMGVLQSRIEEKQAAFNHLSQLLQRSHVKAPRAGIALIDSPSEWVGRPVTVGERVMAVADENDTEIEAWLAPADAIDLPDDARVKLFLNVDPLHPVSAKLRYVEYETQTRPDGTIGHRVRASAEAGEKLPRLGLKGTARLDGQRVPMIYWLLRRPWAVIRQTIGM